MRIRLKKMPHSMPHSFTIMTPRKYEGVPRVIKMGAVGDVSDDMPEALCYELAGLQPLCLEVIKDDKELAAINKATAAPRNKSVTVPQNK